MTSMRAVLIGRECSRTDAVLKALSSRDFSAVECLTFERQGVATVRDIVNLSKGSSLEEGVLIVADNIGVGARLCRKVLNCNRTVHLALDPHITSIPSEAIREILAI